MAQPRHSKGTTCGGQWIATTPPDPPSTPPLNLSSAPRATPSSPSKAIVRLLGFQKTLRYSDGQWQPPYLMADSTMRMLLPPATSLRLSRESGIQIGSTIVQTMLNAGDIAPTPDLMRYAAQSAVKEVYLYSKIDVSSDVDLRNTVTSWEPVPQEYGLVEAMAACHSRSVLQEMGSFQGEHQVWCSHHMKSIPELFNRLMLTDAHRYQGADGNLAKRVLRSMPPPQTRSLLDTIITRLPDAGRRVPPFVGYPSHHGMAFYLLRTGEPDFVERAHTILERLYQISPNSTVAIAPTLKIVHCSVEEASISDDPRPCTTILNGLTSRPEDSPSRIVLNRVMSKLQEIYLPHHDGQATPAELVQAGWHTAYEPLNRQLI